MGAYFVVLLGDGMLKGWVMLGYDSSLHARDSVGSNSILSDICNARQALAGIEIPHTAP